MKKLFQAITTHCPAIQKGHDQLLEICLLKKTAQHNFAFTRQHLSKQFL
jgi:hypothetical protein